MGHRHFVCIPQFTPEFLRHRNGSVAPAGATHGYRQIRLPLPLVSGKELAEQGRQVRTQFLCFGLCQYEVGDGSIETRLRAQVRNEMRVGQVPEIEDQVSVHRDPVPKPKGDDACDHVFALRHARDVVDQSAAQLVNGEARRIDRELGTRSKR